METKFALVPLTAAAVVLGMAFSTSAQPRLADLANGSAGKVDTFVQAASAGAPTAAKAQTAAPASLATTQPATPAVPKPRAVRRPAAQTNANRDESDGPVVTAKPSALTRQQESIDRLRKEDESEGLQLSIAEKVRRKKALRGEDDTPARVPFKVIGIEGRAIDMVATLRYANGEEIEVRAGDRLQDGRPVAAVKSTGVSLGTGARAQHYPVTLTSGRASPAATPQSLPQERILVPMNTPIPAPAAPATSQR